MVPDIPPGEGTRSPTGFRGEKFSYFSRAGGRVQVTMRKPPSTLNFLKTQPSALSPPPSALHPPPSALHSQPSTPHPQPSALSPQPSALSPQLRIPNCQPLTPNGARVLGEELQARVKISPSSTYHYLSSHSPSAPSHSPSLRSVRSPLMTSYPGAPSDFPSSAGADACMLQTRLKALEAIAGEEVMSSVVCAVAAVLHLGDVEIGDASVAGGGRDQASFCVASQSYDMACSLLGWESKPHHEPFKILHPAQSKIRKYLPKIAECGAFTFVIRTVTCGKLGRM
jgi:hypothetical protein